MEFWCNCLLCETGLCSGKRRGWNRDRNWVRAGLRRKWTLGNNTTRVAEQGSSCGLKLVTSCHWYLTEHVYCSIWGGGYSPTCTPKTQNMGAGIWFGRYSILGLDCCLQQPQSVCPVPLFSPSPPSFSPSLTDTVQQPRVHPVSKAPGSDRSTGAGLQGYTPQALDAETGEASRRTCRTTTPPFLTLT